MTESLKPLLTVKQRRIAELAFLQNKSSNEVASLLGLHPATINRHKAEIRQMLGKAEITEQDIVMAVSRIHNGIPLSPDISSLTDREFQVAQLVAQGMENAEIAANQGMTLNSVESAVRTIYRKLNIAPKRYSRQKLTMLMMRSGAMPASLNSTSGQIPCLTQSENEVAYLAAQGYSFEMLSRMTGKATNTIKNQLSAVYRKLGICDQRELMLIGFASGWVTPHAAAKVIDGYASVARKMNGYEW